MEDALREKDNEDSGAGYFVLILVLMEDALRVLRVTFAKAE